MLFPRLQSGWRRPRGIDFRFAIAALFVIAVLITANQLWSGFVDRMSGGAIVGIAPNSALRRE
jgi:hypothetical protein